MAAFTKYNAFIDEIAKGNHDLYNDILKCALTNTTPGPLTDATWNGTTAPPPGNANGYPAGGNTLTRTAASTSAGVFRLILADTIFTASSGGIGPFRYVLLYNSSQANKLVGFYDFVSTITLNVTDTFTVDFDAANGVLTIS